MSRLIYTAEKLIIDHKKVEGVMSINLSFTRSFKVKLEWQTLKEKFERTFEHVETRKEGNRMARIIFNKGESYLLMVNDYGRRVND